MVIITLWNDVSSGDQRFCIFGRDLIYLTYENILEIHIGFCACREMQHRINNMEATFLIILPVSLCFQYQARQKKL